MVPLCRGLGIKRGLESRPIFWHMLHLIAEEGEHTPTYCYLSTPPTCPSHIFHTPLPLLPDATSVVQFHGVALSLCSLLSGHWQQSRVGSTTEQPRELEATCSLLELCRKVGRAPVGVGGAAAEVGGSPVGVGGAAAEVGGAAVGVGGSPESGSGVVLLLFHRHAGCPTHFHELMDYLNL